MTKVAKQFISILMACLFALSVCTPAFANDNSSNTNSNTLSEAQFLKEDGTVLTMNMGVDIIKSATIDDNGNIITIKLQPAEKKALGIKFVGNVDEVYLINSDNVRTTGNLVTDVNGEPTVQLTASQASAIGDTGKNGIKLELHLTMTPFMPPGMHEYMISYFTW